ncbi:Oxoglutarate/iron-dependent dioxygenase [Macleaya cordata]|uniref:Oxoglutarate/iron-dependent dioxygenase n=1 Tax=Macleaya cordata TaxID=56857 RepID=A0A200Q7P9_MACCD|nr:Oxoglutarate/iron-dependent dioxygenase [Macleaya cordata]
MGTDQTYNSLKLPIIDLSGGREDLKPGTDNWFSVRTEVCRAVEEFGCFEAILDKVPLELHNAIFDVVEKVFDLPLETKKRNKSDDDKQPVFSYFGQNPLAPIQEGLSIKDPIIFEQIQSFAKLMWPEGDVHTFCETVHSYTNEVFDMAKKVKRMIFESYGVEKYYDSHMESIIGLLRFNKYRVPGVNESNLGSFPHTDKSFMTVFHQNQVNGLEVRAKNGEWFSVTPLTNSFIVTIGDAFMTWSNGRLHSPHHRVMNNGDKTRYTVAFFTFIKNIVQVPEELIDEEHPLMFKPFDNIGLLEYFVSEEGRKTESRMGSETPLRVPIVDLSTKNLKPGTENWFSVRTEVRRALEEFGCFEAVYDEVPLELHEAMFNAIQELFDLPRETKIRNKADQPYYGYVGQIPGIPIHEGLGINEAADLERVQSFAKLMWPEGNDKFCETVHCFANRVLDLTKKVVGIIFESYGVEKYYDSQIESNTSLLRVMKYRKPQTNEPNLGASPHTDKTLITILQQNQVNGLEIKTRSGEWISGWSNGRLHSPHHRVVHNGDKPRYSLALFTFSKNLVQVPEELVDEEHPLMFKPFDNMGLLKFYVTEEGRKAESTVKAYCGI